MIDKLNIRDDAYGYYLKNYPEKVGQEVYAKIVYGMMKMIVDKMFDEATDIVLPFRLGMFCIRGEHIKPIIVKEKVKKMVVNENGIEEEIEVEEERIRGIAPDWGATRKLWRENPEEEKKKTRIFCFNEHSNGIKYRILWLKRGSLFKNKGVYGFAVTKDNRTRFAAGVKAGNEYLVSDKPPAKAPTPNRKKRKLINRVVPVWEG